MDAKEQGTQQKMKALAAYIDRQLAGGTAPKALYQDLRQRKVSHKLAVEMIEQGIKAGTSLPSPTPIHEPESAPQKPTLTLQERQARIKEYIQTQLDAGKSKNEILKRLVEKNVSREEAVGLIKEAAGQSDLETPPAPEVESQSPAFILPPVGNKDELNAYIVGKLEDGVEMKALVEELVAAGMEHNKAIDLVVEISELPRTEAAQLAVKNKEAIVKRARNKMLIGAALFFGGLFLTIASYSTAEEGGAYWLFYGPIIYGFFSGIVGMVQWFRNM